MLFMIGSAVASILVAGGVLSMYKKCPNNRVLVKYGLGGNKVLTKGSIVFPIVQSHSYLSLIPMNVDIFLGIKDKNVVSADKIRVGVEADATFVISQDENERIIASERLLGLSREAICNLALEILTGQTRTIISQMTYLDLLQNRKELMKKVEESAETELSKIGLDLTNFNIKTLKDYDEIADTLGRKASAEVTSKADIDTAEQEKISKVGVAKLNAEKEISVAEAVKLQETKTCDIDAETAESTNKAKIRTTTSNEERLQEEIKIKNKTSEIENTAEIEKDRVVAIEDQKAKQTIFTEQAKTAKLEAGAELEMKRVSEVVDEKIIAEKKGVIANNEKDIAVIRADAIRTETDAEAYRIETLAAAEAKKQSLPLIERAKAEKELKDVYGDDLLKLKLVEILPEITKASAEAISNIKIDGIYLMGNGEGGEQNQISGLVGDVMKTMPAMKMINELSASLNLPSLGFGAVAKEMVEGEPLKPLKPFKAETLETVGTGDGTNV